MDMEGEEASSGESTQARVELPPLYIWGCLPPISGYGGEGGVEAALETEWGLQTALAIVDEAVKAFDEPTGGERGVSTAPVKMIWPVGFNSRGEGTDIQLVSSSLLGSSLGSGCCCAGSKYDSPSS